MAFETNYSREFKKWDTPRSQGGMRPDHFVAFPRMVYRARRRPTGGPFIVIDPENDAWSMQNCMTALNEEEYERFLKQGWSSHPDDAIKAANDAETKVADEAAHRAFLDRRLSEKAQAEAAAADAESFEHLPEIPEKRKVGRPRKDSAA